jgi:hypothetical protein
VAEPSDNADTGGDLYRLSFDFYCQPDQAEAVVEAFFDACVTAGAAVGVKVEGASGGIVASDFIDDAIADLVREQSGREGVQ